MVRQRDVDLQIFLGSANEGVPQERREGFPSFSFMAAPRAGMRDLPKPASETETQRVGALDYVAVANSEVVESVRLPFSREQARKFIEKLGTNRLRVQDSVSFGTELFDFIFHRRLRDLYRDLLREAKARERALRVTIATSAPELAVLPWEVMCDTYPEILPRFLSHDSRVRLTRALRLYNREHFQENKELGADGELRILAVSAVPPGNALIGAGMDGRIIEYVCKQMRPGSRVIVQLCEDATVERLREVGCHFKPHVVHLACHAGYNEAEDLGVVSLMPSLSARAGGHVHSYRLAMLIHEFGSVQCVFANTCYGARQGEITIFSGIAQALHAVGIANVVALQFALADTTAHAMVLGFYTHLLLQGMAIETAVSQLQRRMYLEGYPPSETFGLVMFQSNCSLRVAPPPARDAARRRITSVPASVAAMAERFEATLWNAIEEEHSEGGLDSDWSTYGDTRWMRQLALSDVLAAFEVFGTWGVALSLLWKVKEIFAPSGTGDVEAAGKEAVHMFVRLARQARRLALSTFETDSLHTGIALIPQGGVEQYRAEYQLLETSTTKVGERLLDMHDGDAVGLALKADGEREAIVVTVASGGATVLQTLAVPVAAPIFPAAAARWRPLAMLAARGCAFAIPGRGRLTLFVAGEQILVLLAGRWWPARLQQVHDRLSERAIKIGIDPPLLCNVFEKALVASAQGVGKAFIVQQRDPVMKRNVASGLLLEALRTQRITEITPEAYLQGAKGDQAVVLDRDGFTIGVNVPLAPSARTKVDRLAGTAARHRSAQQITGETDAVAVVVSSDGPISVFHDGKSILSYLRSPPHNADPPRGRRRQRPRGK